MAGLCARRQRLLGVDQGPCFSVGSLQPTLPSPSELFPISPSMETLCPGRKLSHSLPMVIKNRLRSPTCSPLPPAPVCEPVTFGFQANAKPSLCLCAGTEPQAAQAVETSCLVDAGTLRKARPCPLLTEQHSLAFLKPLQHQIPGAVD